MVCRAQVNLLGLISLGPAQVGEGGGVAAAGVVAVTEAVVGEVDVAEAVVVGVRGQPPRGLGWKTERSIGGGQRDGGRGERGVSIEVLGPREDKVRGQVLGLSGEL